MKIKTETGAMLLQVKEYQELLKPPKLGENMETDSSSEPLEGTNPAWWGFLASRTVSEHISVALSHAVTIICYGSPRQPIHYCVTFWIKIREFFIIRRQNSLHSSGSEEFIFKNCNLTGHKDEKSSLLLLDLETRAGTKSDSSSPRDI